MANLYSFTPELDCDVPKFINLWTKSRINVVNVDEDGMVTVNVQNTTLAELKSFLHDIEDDNDTHYITDSIAVVS